MNTQTHYKLLSKRWTTKILPAGSTNKNQTLANTKTLKQYIQQHLNTF